MKALARCIMVQGTSSNVGKSVLCTALCRIFRQDGYRVAPFKAQNMALNSYVTPDGGEIGRAQGVQAEAAGIEATRDMNPILLKPKSDIVAQVIVRGSPLADMKAGEYRSHYVPQALEIVAGCLARLKAAFDVVVIEGAGSPAEINLKERDIANMKVAEMASAPVLLVADIDRGGSFASLVGTMELLDPAEREMVAGYIINKFRGDAGLLGNGLSFLERRTGKPVLGLVPYLRDIGIDAEDSVCLEEEAGGGGRELEIAVIRLPRISNFTDFDPLSWEGGVAVRYTDTPRELECADAVVLPGSKNTVEDLLWLRQRGLDRAVREARRRGVLILGMCGGYQMLGEELHDPFGAESDRGSLSGLGLLPVSTEFVPAKITQQARAVVEFGEGFWGELRGQEVRGYEIHMGRTRRREGARHLFRIVERGGARADETDGAISADGLVWGSYLHGLFHNDNLRRAFIGHLRKAKGLPAVPEGSLSSRGRRELAYDRLAAAVRAGLDMAKIYRAMGLNPPAG